MGGGARQGVGIIGGGECGAERCYRAREDGETREAVDDNRL
jgi:hypothetical protein